MKEGKSFFHNATPELPLEVSYFASSYVDEKPQPLHRGRTLYILWVKSGQVHFHTAGGVEVLKPGDICVVPPTLLRSVHSVRLDTRYIIFSMLPELFALPSSHFFSREFFQPVLQGTIRLPSRLSPGMQGYDEVLWPLQRLDVRREGTKAYSMVLLTIAMELCNALYPLCDNTAEADNSNWSVSQRCVYYIEQHYQEQITLQVLAEYVHLHPNYLCQLFREQTGKTVFEQINWVRTHAATKLLKSTHLPVSQIAARCGYPNANYFARIFKQFTSRSPTAYRKHTQTK